MAAVPVPLFLGLDSTISAIGLMNAVEQGLPVEALERVAGSVAPSDSSFAFRMVPRATLARRRTAARLSPDEGARVTRLAAVWSLAVDVWKSDEAARDFLFRRHALLEGRRPIDVVLASEFGRPLVEGILGRLQHGSAP